MAQPLELLGGNGLPGHLADVAEITGGAVARWHRCGLSHVLWGNASGVAAAFYKAACGSTRAGRLIMRRYFRPRVRRGTGSFHDHVECLELPCEVLDAGAGPVEFLLLAGEHVTQFLGGALEEDAFEFERFDARGSVHAGILDRTAAGISSAVSPACRVPRVRRVAG